ncbi:MarR family transcriptional regulator [Sphingomonas sp. HITSZ_GF]|uniref:MarR family winged helix-turn-helix transcriptional regulator n=1 Tax=Sphingomonas sp. HITSZ_GF TaxID=3037247 RepID=UPI00240D0572|nr:MarR family transcriptional regulator [Sphingomonas sp. HITSZ_GF]MDG2534191.1 MarR family transcriptional regulator [Sphingomonas sp. HITSZ_GF]
MSRPAPLREKHDGALDDRGSVRLWLRLLTCTTVIEKRLKRGFADQYDMTLPRFDVMAALDRHPEGMTMGQLSQALLVSNGNVTGVVQALVRDRYVSLAPSPTDGRSSIVRLSQLGRECFAGLAEAHHEWIEAMLAGLGREERGHLHQLLGVLKDSLAADGEKE